MTNIQWQSSLWLHRSLVSLVGALLVALLMPTAPAHAGDVATHTASASEERRDPRTPGTRSWNLPTAPGASLLTFVREADTATRTALLRQATYTDSVFARYLRPSQRSLLDRLDAPPLYVVEASVDAADNRLRLSMSALWTHTDASGPAATELVFRVFPNGRHRWKDGITNLTIFDDDGPLTYHLVGTLLRVTPRNPVLPGDVTTIHLDLTQQIPPISETPMSQVVSSEYTGVYGHRDGLVNLGYWLPQFTPWHSSLGFDDRALPRNGEHAWFEPSFYHVTFDTRSSWTVASTGVEVWKGQVSPDTSRHQLVAGAVREFSVVTSPHFGTLAHEIGDVLIRVFYDKRTAPSGGDARTARRVIDHAVDAHHLFESRFGPQPASEIDVVLTTGNLTMGTEYPGLLTIHHDVIVDHAASPGLTVAHEMAHQWWYSDVGSDSAAAPWLDEALTSYSAALYWEHRYGSAAKDLELAIHDQEALYVEPSPRHPANRSANSYDLSTYGPIIYGRAPIFFEYTRQLLGDDAFFAALSQYHERYMLRFATEDDLLDILRRHTRRPDLVDDLFDQWIVGQDPSGHVRAWRERRSRRLKQKSEPSSDNPSRNHRK